MCAQHLVGNEIVYNGSYQMLLNNITGLEVIQGVRGPLSEVAIRAITSNEATVDVNGDGEIWVGNEITPETPIGGVNSTSASRLVRGQAVLQAMVGVSSSLRTVQR